MNDPRITQKEYEKIKASNSLTCYQQQHFLKKKKGAKKYFENTDLIRIILVDDGWEYMGISTSACRSYLPSLFVDLT